MSKEGFGMKMISDEQVAYLAGFLEGEGCFYVADPRKQRNALVSVNQKSPEVLRYLLKITGIGRIDKRIRRRRASGWGIPGNSICFWRVTKQEEVIPLIQRILPYLINERTRKRARCVLRLSRLRVKYNNGGRKNFLQKVIDESRIYQTFQTTMVQGQSG